MAKFHTGVANAIVETRVRDDNQEINELHTVTIFLIKALDEDDLNLYLRTTVYIYTGPPGTVFS